MISNPPIISPQRILLCSIKAASISLNDFRGPEAGGEGRGEAVCLAGDGKAICAWLAKTVSSAWTARSSSRSMTTELVAPASETITTDGGVAVAGGSSSAGSVTDAGCCITQPDWETIGGEETIAAGRGR